MRVFTKKTLEFKNRETGKTVRTPVLDFCDLPEWAIKDPLYGWAKADGDLEELATKAKTPKGSGEDRVSQ